MNVYLKLMAVFTTGAILAGCASSGDSVAMTDEVKAEAAIDLSAPIVINDEGFLKKSDNTHTSYTVDGDAVTITFDKITASEAASKWPNMKFRPVAGIYDWSAYKGLKLTLENLGPDEARIEMKVADNIGIMGAATHQLDLPIYLPSGLNVVEFMFDGKNLGLSDYRGGEDLDLTQIPEFQFYAVGPIGEQLIKVIAIDYIK
jgi:agarase